MTAIVIISLLETAGVWTALRLGWHIRQAWRRAGQLIAEREASHES